MRARMVIFGLGRNSIVALEYFRFELHSMLLDLDDRFPEVPKKPRTLARPPMRLSKNVGMNVIMTLRKCEGWDQ